LVILVCCIAVAGSCQAHQKWLLPNFFIKDKGPVWLSFDVTWSDTPFVAESAVGEQPLAVICPDGTRETPPSVFVGKTKSVAEMELTHPGTYRLEAIDPLTYWAQVEVDGKEKWLRSPKNEVKEGTVKRSDLYWSKAVAYVTIGEPTDLPPPDASEPLELTLSQHPSGLKAGDKLELRVVSYGKPVPGAKVQVFGPTSTGHAPTATIKCNDEGAGSYELPVAGRFLFSVELEQKTPDDPKADLKSFHVYLVMEVRGKE
jgi:uncharacterized GH25 family protein